MNLTFAGLYKNIELVEKYNDPRIVESLIHNFESVFNSAKVLEIEI
jgi:hypothetical protein